MKYSFVIPVYGCEKYLESCVASILAQEGDHAFEVILVDDGSQDRSGQIADELAQGDSRIRVFHKENGGAASARNLGLREAGGDYILFIDGDDTVEAGLLNQVDAVLSEDPEALIVFGMSFDFYRDNACIRAEVLSCGHEGCFSVNAMLDSYAGFFSDNALSSACNKVFSAQIIRRHDLRMKEGMTLYEDYDFVLRYLKHIEKVVCVAQPFYHYRHDLGDNHLNRRVADMEKLQRNLGQLLRSSQALSRESIQLREVSAGLYLQLLWQHLMVKKYTVSELGSCLPGYCEDACFRSMLSDGTKLGANEEKLLRLIDAGDFRQVSQMLKRSKAKAWFKRGVKRLLRLIGLRK